MPAQSLTSGAAYYVEGDTKPLIRQLQDSSGNGLDLTDAASVTIRIGHATYDHYYSPMTPIVDDAACAITDAPNGWVQWNPLATQISPPGTFHYTFRITWNDGTRETIPPNTYETLIIRARQGGAGV